MASVIARETAWLTNSMDCRFDNGGVAEDFGEDVDGVRTLTKGEISLFRMGEFDMKGGISPWVSPFSFLDDDFVFFPFFHLDIGHY